MTQETFLAAYANFKFFDGQNEKAWLCRIATNKCLDYWKRAERRTQVTTDSYFETLKDTGTTPEENALEEDWKEKLQKACHQLKEPYQEVAILYYYYEMDVKEISNKLGKNLKTIQTQIYRAKALLKKSYRKECGDHTYSKRAI